MSVPICSRTEFFIVVYFCNKKGIKRHGPGLLHKDEIVRRQSRCMYFCFSGRDLLTVLFFYPKAVVPLVICQWSKLQLKLQNADRNASTDCVIHY